MLSAPRFTLPKKLLHVFPLLVALLFLLTGRAQAQHQQIAEDCSGGNHYLIAFPDTTQNYYDARFPAQLLKTNTRAFLLYIYSPVNQTMMIGYGDKAKKSVELSAGQILEFNIDSIGSSIIRLSNAPQNNVVEINTEYPVIVYAYMLTAFGSEAFTPIPVELWGTEYYAAAWPGQIVNNVFPNGEFNYKALRKAAPAELLIIAAQDNTQVDIRSEVDLKECVDCKKVTLMAGQAYLVQTVVDTSATATSQPDLGGTLIQSNKPIGVVSGNTRLMHNAGVRPSLAENSYKNLAIEWLPPVEQHGTQFVFTPTWDDRRQRQELDPEESRGQELVRLFASTMESGTQSIDVRYYDSKGDSIPTTTTPLKSGESTIERIDQPVARAFTTSGPAFAVMAPESVVKFNGTTTYGANYVGAAYLSWSTFMVELVPREQWNSFAPVRAPSLPKSMVHYLNLVADSADQFNVYYRRGDSPGQLFPFNRGVVPGTDLVWGTIPLDKGVDYFIEGDKGARFTGHAYGSYRGQEQYRPGRTRKDDPDGKGSALSGGGGADAPGTLHPSEYEEDVALMYGYPLAPSRCVLASPGVYSVQTEKGCGWMVVTITNSGGGDAAGLRSITMVPDSSENIRLEFQEPSSPGELPAAKNAQVALRVIDLSQDAHAVLIIRDRSRDGQPIRVEYHYVAERLDFTPEDVLEFRDIPLNETSDEKSITVTNPTQSPIVVRHLGFVFGNQEFRIARTEPSFDWSGGADSIVLAPGQSMVIWVNITPKDTGRIYEDSLRVRLNCRDVSYVVRALPVLSQQSCLMVGDIDFGTLYVNDTRTLQLDLCNRGDLDITFSDPWVTWLGKDFKIEPTDIDKLKGITLRKDECLTISVRFSTADTGTFRTVARFWANTRDCRDTSVWTARVIGLSTGVAGDAHRAGYAITGVTPNPLTRDARISFRLGQSGETVVDVYNSVGERVDRLVQERLEAGEHHLVWNAEGSAAGVYHVRITSGEWSGSKQLILVR